MWLLGSGHQPQFSSLQLVCDLAAKMGFSLRFKMQKSGPKRDPVYDLPALGNNLETHSLLSLGLLPTVKHNVR
jgi:hypothetical protein